MDDPLAPFCLDGPTAPVTGASSGLGTRFAAVLPGALDGALLYLASGASSYATGQVLAVDGGYTAVDGEDLASGASSYATGQVLAVDGGYTAV